MVEINKKEKKDWRVLEFFVPIEEKITENDDFLIRGVAINETTTLNNVKYIAEELEKAAVSFRNVPVLLDHRNEVKNIVGRTTENVNYSSGMKRIEFEAKIMDKDIREMISDGRIGSVSIGAHVENLTEEEDGSMKAIGIHGLEISLVAVPGDSQATLAHAIENGIHLKEKYEEKAQAKKLYSASVETKKLNLKTEENMTEEEITKKDQEEVVEVEKEEKEEVSKEVPEETEEKTQKIDVKIDTSELADMKKQISELKELLTEKKKIQEKIKEKMVDNTKGNVSEVKKEVDNELSNRVIEAVGKGNYALYRDYTNEGLDTKLKRLVR